MSNIIILNTNFFLWVNINYAGTYGGETSLDEFDPTGISEVSLSGNKAVLLYADKLKYYQFVNNKI